MATRIVEGKKPYTGGKAIEIDENKVISLRLREENNLIIWDEGDNEIYVDLQLPDGVKPLDAFPVGVNVGRVLIADDWDVNGTLVVFKTTSGDNIKLLYGDDGKLYIDNGTGLFKQIYLKGEVDALLQALKDYTDAQLALKQDILIAGEYIEIEDNVISAVIPTISRFLSIWNASSGEPVSFPASVPFTYATGDYYLIEGVGASTNYRPAPVEYDGTASQIPEPDTEVADGDVYIYDGTVWLLQENHNKTVSFQNIAGDPYDNTNLATALNAKANTTDVLTKSNTTSYTPSGNYNPATKKYVDDGLSNKQATLVSGTNIKSINSNSLLGSGDLSIAEVPSGGTNGQVLTQTSQGPAWQNATGGADIEYKTQAEYEALLPGALTDNKHYFIYTSDSPTPPSPRQPGANTVLYLPLDGDVVDYSSYARTMTVYGASASVGTPVFSNITGGKQVANFIATDPNNSNWFAFTENLTDIPTSGDMTLSFWMSWSGDTTNDYEHIVAYRNQNGFTWMSMISNNGNFLFHGSGQENTTFYPTIGTWYHMVCVVDNGTCNIYQDGNLIYTDSYTYGSRSGGLGIGAYPETFHTNGRFEPYNGLLSEVIIENIAWSAQEVADYYDQTKGDYGIS